MKAGQIPLLSICIPTYNRAHLLEAMLASLLPQVKAASPEVELVVSDNSSTDDTSAVVERAQQLGPLRYYRNPENLGVTRNFLRLTCELARGEYCWILGDDDMLVKDKLQRLLGVLRNNSDLDCFFINFFAKTIDERDTLIRQHDSGYVAAPGECMCQDFGEYRLDKWDYLLDLASVNPAGLHTPVVGSISRRSIWTQAAYAPDFYLGGEFSSLESTYPHSVVIARSMVGRPAYYLGEPCVLMGHGSQEWFGYVPMLYATRVQELLDLYAKLGVDKGRVERCRGRLLSDSRSALRSIMLDPTTPGRRNFSLAKFIRQNRLHGRGLGHVLGPIFREWLHKKTKWGVFAEHRTPLRYRMLSCVPARLRRLLRPPYEAIVGAWSRLRGWRHWKDGAEPPGRAG